MLNYTGYSAELWVLVKKYTFARTDTKKWKGTVGVIAKETVCNDNKNIDLRINADDVVIGGNKRYDMIKRILDAAASAVAMIVLLVPMLIIAALIKMDSKGPAIYSQERLGLNGKPFVMYKFRSMGLDAEINGPQWADEDDQRCTKLGRLLRKTRLDELPQLYNILVGDMSFVGPRPERECFYIQFEEYIPGFKNRMVVMPGLTGHAQVNGGYSLKPEEKIVFDMEYIANRSLKMDLQCIWKTIRVVLFREGAR